MKFVCGLSPDAGTFFLKSFFGENVCSGHQSFSFPQGDMFFPIGCLVVFYFVT